MTKAKNPSKTHYQLDAPKLPSNFTGAMYGNRLSVSATAQELFLDIHQIVPETGSRGEAVTVFMGRFIMPLALAKTLLAEVGGIVTQIEADEGVVLPEPQE